MQLLLYNKDTFKKDAKGEKELAIVNINTKHYNNTAIIMNWTKDRVIIEKEDVIGITIDNDGITLTTKNGIRDYKEIEAVTGLDDKTYGLIASIWGLITKLWGDK